MNKLIECTQTLYDLRNYEYHMVAGHEGGRNSVYVFSENGESKYVLRIAELEDRTKEDFFASDEGQIYQHKMDVLRAENYSQDLILIKHLLVMMD